MKGKGGPRNGREDRGVFHQDGPVEDVLLERHGTRASEKFLKSVPCARLQLVTVEEGQHRFGARRINGRVS